MFEALVLKIGLSVLAKNTIVAPAATMALNGMTIYSTIEATQMVVDVAKCLLAKSDCEELGVRGAETLIEASGEMLFDKILSTPEQSLEFVENSAGIFVTSDLCETVEVPPILLPDKNIRYIVVSSKETGEIIHDLKITPEVRKKYRMDQNGDINDLIKEMEPKHGLLLSSQTYPVSKLKLLDQLCEPYNSFEKFSNPLGTKIQMTTHTVNDVTIRDVATCRYQGQKFQLHTTHYFQV